MNHWIRRLLVGGVGSAIVGAGALGATASPVFAAATGAATAAPAAHHGDRHGDRHAIAKVVFEAEASVLGITPDQLRDDVKKGQKVSDLARDKGLSKEQFADKLGAAVKPGLDKLVDAKTITRAQADRELDRISKGHIPFWNGAHAHQAA